MVKTMKKIAIGLILLMVLATISVYAEDNPTKSTKAKAERMIKLCERAQNKLSSILEKTDNKEAEKLFKDACRELDKAKDFYNKEDYDKSIESSLEAMHKFRECAALIKEEAGTKIKERIEGQIERLEKYISRIKENTQDEEILTLLDNAESHLEKAKTYLNDGDMKKARSEIKAAVNVLKNIKEQWKNRYQEKIKQRIEKLAETADKRVGIYHQILERFRENGYNVEDLERELSKIESDLSKVHSLINNGKYREALSGIKELYKEMQEFQENLRRIRNES